jgi:hypothetical protein
VIADGGDPWNRTQSGGCEERGPLRLDVGGLDLVTAGDQQLGFRVRVERDFQCLSQPAWSFGHVARRADLRVAEEQEVEVAVELAGLELVRLGPGTIAATRYEYSCSPSAIEDRVAVESSVDTCWRRRRRSRSLPTPGTRRSTSFDVGAT